MVLGTSTVMHIRLFTWIGNTLLSKGSEVGSLVPYDSSFCLCGLESFFLYFSPKPPQYQAYGNALGVPVLVLLGCFPLSEAMGCCFLMCLVTESCKVSSINLLRTLDLCERNYHTNLLHSYSQILVIQKVAGLTKKGSCIIKVNSVLSC